MKNQINDIIDKKINVVSSNFKHIAKTGKINGSLRLDLSRILQELLEEIQILKKKKQDLENIVGSIWECPKCKTLNRREFICQQCRFDPSVNKYIPE